MSIVLEQNIQIESLELGPPGAWVRADYTTYIVWTWSGLAGPFGVASMAIAQHTLPPIVI
jgi:hypothetical protein